MRKIIAFVHDMMWNRWLEEEIKRNGNRPPNSIIAREVSRKRSNEELIQLINDLRRDKWMEPLAVAVMIAINVAQVCLCAYVFVGKVTESSTRMNASLSVLSVCNYISAIFITTSFIYYDTNYELLSRGVTVEGQFYGDYHELRHCQLNAAIVTSKEKLMKGACQMVALKITAVVLLLLLNLVYLAFFSAAIFAVLQTDAKASEDDSEPNEMLIIGSISPEEMIIEPVMSFESDHDPSVENT
jgi:hypothetical protein